MNKLIYLFGGAAILALLYNKKRAAQDLQFNWLGLKYTGKKISDFKIWLQIEVRNQNNTALSFKNLFGTIYEGKTKLGTIEIKDNISIPANSSTIVNLPIKFNYGGLTYVLGEVILMGKKPIFNAVGSFDSLGIQFGFNEKLTLS